MDATTSCLLFLAVSFSSLAGAQAIQPITPPAAPELPGIASHSRTLATRVASSPTTARATTGQSGYPSAIVPDASPASSFAGFYSAPFYPSISSSSAGNALLTGDFNHDGKPDLLSLNFDGVAVLLNDGTGGFSSPISLIPSGFFTDSPVAYAVDLNGDGYTDLVIAGYTVVAPTGAFQVAVLLNHKDGTFPTITYLPLQSPGFPVHPGPTGTVAQGKTTTNGGIDLGVGAVLHPGDRGSADNHPGRNVAERWRRQLSDTEDLELHGSRAVSSAHDSDRNIG